MLSGSIFNNFALTETNHLQRMKDCTEITDQKKLIEYLKVADGETLAKCHSLSQFGKTLLSPWTPTIERATTIGAFLSKTPEDIYNSDTAPVLDTWFSFASQVRFYISNYFDLFNLVFM